MQIADATGIADERQVSSPSMFTIMTLMHSLQCSHEDVVDLNKLTTSINKYIDHKANCSKCKKGKKPDQIGLVQWIMDSGASQHFTNNFSEYTPIKDGHEVKTAAKSTPLQIKGKGTIFLSHKIDMKGSQIEVIT